MEEWTSKVMEVKDRPIILDCYAEWCAPCKKLGPMLEEVTREHEGRFRLIKLNIDDIPQLTKALQVRSIPTLFLIYRGNVIDMITGVDKAKLDEFVKTALLVEKAQHDEGIMTETMAQAQEMIESGKFAEAAQILTDASSYEQWMQKLGSEINTGIAFCQLMKDQDTVAARNTLATMTEAQVLAMPQDSYWASLIYKVDEEIQRLEALALPDEAENSLRERITASPDDLPSYFELAELLVGKNRGEEAIPLLLDILSIDRNW